jgi:carbamoylphosphate synthase small subunit
VLLGEAKRDERCSVGAIFPTIDLIDCVKLISRCQPLLSLSTKHTYHHHNISSQSSLLPEVLKMTEESEYLKQSSQLGNIDRPQVAILDFGSQYSHLIARRVREMHVYCELYSCLVTAEELGKHKLTAVILSGGPNSVYEEGAPHVAEGVWKLIEERNVPVLGICYGMQVGLYS